MRRALPRLLYAVWMGAMGFAGGYLLNYWLLADTADLWSQTWGWICAGGAALIGFVSALLFYDESF